MPELPEVETVRRGLEPAMTGATITTADIRRPDLRFPFPDRFAERLGGRRVLGLGRRAKYLLARLDHDETLVMHLGMSGSFRIEHANSSDGETPGSFHHARSRDAIHDHVVLHLGSGADIVYNDPRRFGFMTLVADDALDSDKLFCALGIEPLGNMLTADFINSAFRNKTTSVKAALLDQRLIAGLGNIYACEALFRSGISPRRHAQSITRARGGPSRRAEKLTAAIRDVLAEAIQAGGSTLRDHAQTDGSLGYFQHAFRVYDREHAPCVKPGCRGVVRRIVQAGRSTFYCPECQR